MQIKRFWSYLNFIDFFLKQRISDLSLLFQSGPVIVYFEVEKMSWNPSKIEKFMLVTHDFIFCKNLSNFKKTFHAYLFIITLPILSL